MVKGSFHPLYNDIRDILDMEDCARCWEAIRESGDLCASRLISNSHWLPYGICYRCYKVESKLLEVIPKDTEEEKERKWERYRKLWEEREARRQERNEEYMAKQRRKNKQFILTCLAIIGIIILLTTLVLFIKNLIHLLLY